MKKNVFAMTIGIAVIAWGCSKIQPSGGVRQSVENGVAGISHAISSITATTGYQLLSGNGSTAKSSYTMKDTINLGMIAGIYDFQPDTVMHLHYFSPYRLFKRTGESENMVVNLPEILVMHPGRLHFFALKDTVYPNNFTITATDYHVYFGWWNNYEYKLAAQLMLNNENAGSMDVSTTSRYEHSNSYSSSFTFDNGYNIADLWQDGDTATSSFSLSMGNDTLFMENNVFIRTGFHMAERQYTLTIGNVRLMKSPGVDSLQVFVDGTLQNVAARIITSTSDTTASVCQRRDILLTYNDGTTSTLSSLLDPIKTQLNDLRDSLHNMYFSKQIIDYIALSIYYNAHPYYD